MFELPPNFTLQRSDYMNFEQDVLTGDYQPLTIHFSRCGSHMTTLSSGFEICRKLGALIGCNTVDALNGSVLASLPRSVSGVTYALERRISRENIGLAQQIEKLATWIRQTLEKLPPKMKFLVYDFDTFDDVSVKLLARVIPFSTQPWEFMCSATRLSPERKKLLERFEIASGAFISRYGIAISSDSLSNTSDRLTLLELGRELVLTNYGACFALGAQQSVSEKPEAQSEMLRIHGIAAINRGMYQDSLDALSAAEVLAPSRFRKAHLACLQSLVAQKRLYEPAIATAHVLRGLVYLDGSAEDHDREHYSLEYAWLLNSQALCAAIQFRKTGDVGSWKEAMRLVQEAFTRSRGFGSPGHMYLRFNLAANTVFLFEMRGAFEKALSVLEQSFAQALSSSSTVEQKAPESFCYRRAILLSKMGRVDEALEILEAIVPELNRQNLWFLAERVIYACTSIAERARHIPRAIESAGKGLEICIQARSALGVKRHNDDLNALTGKLSFSAVGIGPGDLPVSTDLSIPGTVPRRSPPPPKLPSYIPEIDLEEVPQIDLNQYLARNTSTGATLC